MIFVVLGTQKFQLNRLLRLLENGVLNGEIKDEIVAQTGASDYEPQSIRCYRYLEEGEFAEYMDKAAIIVTHSGVGSIMTALRKGKPVVVFPRMKKYGEHVDDHQIEIAGALADKGYVLLCGEADDLPRTIEKAASFKFSRYESGTMGIVNLIEGFLREN